MNVSHSNHDFSFGLKYPGHHNPLDGMFGFCMRQVEHANIYLKVLTFGFSLENDIELFSILTFLKVD